MERAMPDREHLEDRLRESETAGTETSHLVRRRLSVGAANDPLEREADAVARDVVDRIRRAGEGADDASDVEHGRVRRSASVGASGQDASDASDVASRVRRSASVGASGGVVDADVERRIRAARGRPLPPDVNRSMSGAMGVDFSGVRIHDDRESGELSSRLNAEAFTVGSKVFLARKFDGGSRGGQELLAHELAHVVQQGGAQRAFRSLDDQGHDVACPCPACGMSVVRQQVSRRLDDKYTSASIKTDGHETSYFISKSTFAKLLDALDVYHGSTSSSEQFAALTKVQTAITAFLSSKTRGKSRKGSDKTKEAAKVQLVQDLQADVVRELGDLDAAPTNDLLNMHMADSQDTVVLVVAKNLAAKMNVTLPELAGLSATTLKERFITEVYLPEYMEERAGRKPAGMSVAEQIEQIRSISRVDDTKLTRNSDALTLFRLFEQADIGKYVNRLSDPKFGTGSEEYAPSVPGWDAANTMKIQGGDDYRQKVIGLIDEIARTDVGKRLLGGIGGVSGTTSKASGAVHSANKKIVAEVRTPSLANVNYKDATTGRYMYANSAGQQSANVDAFNDIIGADPSKAQDEKFRQRDAAIGLFHELVHVYVGKVDEEFASVEDPTETMKPGQMYEPRVAGIKIRETRNGKTVTFPFDDPTYAYVTENTFRREYAKLKGQSDYYVRPYYMQTDPSEVMGPTRKQKV